jgi:hypothetical protein
VPIRGLIDGADLKKLKDAIEDDIRTPGPFFHGNMRVWETHAAFRDICLNSELPEIASVIR